MGWYYGYNDETVRKYYDAFSKTNKSGPLSFDQYKKTANKVLETAHATRQPTKYKPPTRWDEESGESLYTDEEYNKLKADKEKMYFDDVDAAARVEASKLGGAVSTRHAAGSYGDPESEGYSERIRGNIRKAIGRKG